MPIYLGDKEISKEYVDSYETINLYLGGTLVQGADPFIRANGGTVTFDGNYKIHTFSTVGTSSFTITALGYPTNNSIEYLVVGGGGGGSLTHRYNNSAFSQGFGGGAGGVQTGSIIATNSILGANNIIVGNGGLGTNQVSEDQENPGKNGEYSSALGITAISGSGAEAFLSGGTSISGNGFGPGANIQPNAAPGGGGASEQGDAPANPGTPNGGNGGDGIASSITGTSVYYGGGGGGSPQANGQGLGGLGGGGNSGATSNNGENGKGGGGGGFARGVGNKAGNGGSGVVILRYRYK